MEGWDSLFDLVSWLSFWLVLMASRAVDALRGGISGSRRWRTEAGGSVQVSDLFWIRIVFRCDLLICLSIRPEIVDIFCGKLGRCGFGVGGGGVYCVQAYWCGIGCRGRFECWNFGKQAAAD